MTTHTHKTTNLIPSLQPSDNAFIVDHTRLILSNSRMMLAETGVVTHSHARGQLLCVETGV